MSVRSPSVKKDELASVDASLDSDCSDEERSVVKTSKKKKSGKKARKKAMAKNVCSYEHVAMDKSGHLDLMTKHGVVLRVEVSKDAIVDVPHEGRCIRFRKSMVNVAWAKCKEYDKGSMSLSKRDFLKRHQDAMVVEALDRLVKEGIMQYGNGHDRPVFELGTN